MSSITNLRMSKTELLEKVSPMCEKEFRSYINPIIAKSRGLSIEDAKPKKIVQTNEVLAFFAKIGESIKNYD